MKKQLFSVLSFLMLCIGVQAQITLISPTGDGGFETGTTFAANSWSVAQTPTTRVWYAGTGQAGYTGNRAAFIGNSTTAVGTSGAARIVHLYKSVTIPAGADNIVLSFKYKQAVADQNYDYLGVALSANTPTYNVDQTDGLIGYLNPAANTTFSVFTTVTVTLANTYAGATNNLIFSFTGDGFTPNAYGAIDDVSLTYVMPTCPSPASSSINATSILGTAVNFTWSPVGSTSAWDLYYGAAPLTAPVVGTTPTATTSTASYSITGLTPSTPYTLYVRANCGAGDVGPWMPVNFASACTSTNIPYVQDFESVTTPAIPACTSVETIGAGNTWKTLSPAAFGFLSKTLNYGYNSTLAANTWFYTHGLNLTSGVSYRLTYRYGNNGGTTFPESMKVNYGTSAINTAMTSTLSNHPSITNNVTPITYTVDFTPSATGVYYIGFNANSLANEDNLFVDDITVNLAPTCFAPTALTTTNTTTSGTDLSWTTPTAGTPASYNWEVRTSGAAGSGATGLATSGTVAATSTSVAVTGLTPSTSYSVYVQSNCGSGDLSPWTSVKTFTTIASCPVPTSLTVSAITPTTATATWTAGSTESAWDVYYGVSPLTPPTAGTAATATTSTNSYSFTSLTPSSNYTVYVRANCGTGNTSIWTPLVSFMTPCLAPNITGTTPGNRCGTGTTTISAVGGSGNLIQWYANPTGGSAIATGTMFTTPTLTSTTNYYVTTSNTYSGSQTIGTGVSTGISAAYNLTNGTYGGLKAQYLYTAAELNAAGFGPGNITNMAFDLTTAGSTLNGFVVEVGTTNLTTFAATDIQGGLTTVAPAANITPVVGMNTINFATPFNWNGTSNIIVSVSWSNNNTGNTNSTIKYDATSNYASQTYRKDSETAANMAAFTGSVGTGTSTFDRTQSRPKFTFSGTVLCESARTMVIATVNTAPALTTSSPAAVCGSYGIATLSITSTLSNYDSYVWTPTTGLYTDAAATTAYTGGTATTVYVNSATSGTLNYSVSANNSTSGCAAITSASVSILSLPSIVASANPTLACSGATVNLDATGFSAASGTIAIGTATAVTTPTTELTAFSNRRISYRMQTVYTAAELSAQGLSSGNITSIAYNITSVGDAANNTLYTVKMGTTTVNAFTDFVPNTGFATVFNPATYTHSVGLNTINFNTPFLWDGVSNIVVEVGHDGIDAIYNAETYYTATTGNMLVYSYNGAATGTPTTDRLNIIIGGQKNVSQTSNYTWSWNPGATNSNTVAVTTSNTGSTTTTETYTVTALDPATTCTNSAMVSFSVSPIPTVMAMTSNTAVCAGSSATLTAMGATNYTWTAAGTSSTQVVMPTTASVYTVTGEALGCSNTATVSVDVNPSPIVTAISSQAVLCDDGSTGPAILTASTTATSYLWSDGAMTMTTSVTPTTTSTYTVTVTEAGCSTDAFVTVTVSNCTGVNTVAALANGINVYPNPTNGILNIAISSELAGVTSIEVYDAIGKLVIKEILSTETTTINTTKLTDGMYVYKVINNNKAIKIGKIVKQ